MSIRKIAESISKSIKHIQLHLNLLDLPDDIQAQIHTGEIPYSKARQLTILTREPERTVVITGRTEDGKIKEFITQPAERTERWFPELRVIADEATREGSPTSKRDVENIVRSHMPPWVILLR